MKKYNDEKKKNIYAEINMILFNENKIKDAKELVNKYQIENKEQNNDNNKNKLSFPAALQLL